MIKDATKEQNRSRYDLFLSYHSSDRRLATQVYDTLSRAGVKVWFDQVCITVGDSWLRAIEKALSEVHTFLVLLSDSAPQRWVDAEVSAAIRRYYPDPDSFRIIPVVLSRPDGRQPESLGMFLGAFQRTLVGVHGEQIDSAALAELVATVRSSAPQSAPTPKFDGEPYRGLETYLTEHQHLYFGRHAEVAELVERATGKARWLQIEGASGSGKSSLVRAGLIPALSRGVGQQDDDWCFLTMRPGNHPLKELAVSLLKLFPDDRAPGRLSRMEQALTTGPSALTNILREWNQDNSPERPRPVLLVVDQFEELFTQRSSADGENFEDRIFQRQPVGNKASWSSDVDLVGEADGDFEIENDEWRRLDVREQFALFLRAALSDRDGPLRLVTTIRSDFLHHLAGHKGLARDLNRAERYVVGPLSHEALKQVIVQPLRMSGGRMESDELLERLLEDTESGPGRLPLLSHALRALWLRASQRDDAEPTLRAADYEAIGGVGGAVTQSADALLASLPPAQRDVARRMFLELVRVGRGTRDVRKTAERDALLRAGEHAGSSDAKVVTDVLLQLSGGRLEAGPTIQAGAPRLLVVDEQNQVDVVHDALIDEWETLRNWLNEARRDLERRDDLEAAARAWLNSGRINADLPGPGLLAYYSKWDTDPPPPVSKTAEDYLQRGYRRQRLQRRLMFAVIAVLAVTSAVFSAVGVWGTQQFKIAGQQAGLADEYRQEAREHAARAADGQTLADLRLKQSLSVITALMNEAQVDSDADEARIEQAERLLSRLCDALDILGRDLPDDTETLRLKMLVHRLSGDLAMRQNNPNRAITECRDCLDATLTLLAREPGQSEAKHNLDATMQAATAMTDEIAYVIYPDAPIDVALAERRQELMNLFQHAQAKLSDISSQQPTDSDLRSALAGCYENLAVLETAKTRIMEIDLPQIIRLLETAAQTRCHNVAELPQDDQVLTALLATLNELHDIGHELINQRDHAQALQVFENILSVAKPLHDRAADSPVYVELIAVMHLHVGEMLVRLDRTDESRPAFETAASTYAKLLQMQNLPQDIMSWSPSNFGRALFFLQRYDEAEKVLQDVLAGVSPQRQDHAMLGLVRLHQGKSAEALQEYERALGEGFYGLQEFDLDDMAEELRCAARQTRDLSGADEVLKLIEHKRQALTESQPVDGASTDSAPQP